MSELEWHVKKLSNDGKSHSFQENDEISKSNWQFNKVVKFTAHPDTVAKHVWCDKHGKGAYMPHPRDQYEWFKKIQAKRNARDKYN